MSAETPAAGDKPTAPPAAGDKPTATPAAGEPPDWEAEAAKWRAMARKHEDQAKANMAAAEKLAQREEADKSELQRATEAMAREKQRADEAELRALRAEIASEKGLGPTLARRLLGATREEIEADADALLEAVKGAGGTPPPAGRPRETLRSGTTGSEHEEHDPRKLAAMVPRD